MTTRLLGSGAGRTCSHAPLVSSTAPVKACMTSSAPTTCSRTHRGSSSSSRAPCQVDVDARKPALARQAALAPLALPARQHPSCSSNMPFPAGELCSVHVCLQPLHTSSRLSRQDQPQAADPAAMAPCADNSIVVSAGMPQAQKRRAGVQVHKQVHKPCN